MADPLLDDPEYKTRRSQIMRSRLFTAILGGAGTLAMYMGIPMFVSAIGMGASAFVLPVALLAAGALAIYASWRTAVDQQAGMEEVNAKRSAKALAATTLTVQPALQPSLQQEQGRADGQSWVDASKANASQQVVR